MKNEDNKRDWFSDNMESSIPVPMEQIDFDYMKERKETKQNKPHKSHKPFIMFPTLNADYIF